MREAGEDADDVELDQPGDVGVEGDDEQHREAGEQQDAVAEHQLVAAGVQLPGHEAVLREHRAQQREAVEGGVRGQDEHQRGGGLDVEEADRGVAAERGRGDLRDDRALRLGLAVREALQVAGVLDVLDVGQQGQRGHAGEHGGRDAAHQGQRGGGVAALRRLERRDAVGDGLDAGQRGAPGGEGAEREEEQRQARQAACTPDSGVDGVAAPSRRPAPASVKNYRISPVTIMTAMPLMNR